jgi:uncharacterized paraquat-inducible protein A
MKTIDFDCAGCRRTIHAPKAKAGQKAECPRCHEENIVPLVVKPASEFDLTIISAFMWTGLIFAGIAMMIGGLVAVLALTQSDPALRSVRFATGLYTLGSGFVFTCLCFLLHLGAETVRALRQR